MTRYWKNSASGRYGSAAPLEQRRRCLPVRPLSLPLPVSLARARAEPAVGLPPRDVPHAAPLVSRAVEPGESGEPVQSLTWEALEQRVSECTLCTLCEKTHPDGIWGGRS